MTISTLPDVTEVVRDQIYLGDLKSARCPEQLSVLGITHVVSICHESVNYPSSSKIKHLRILVADAETEDLLIHLPDACQFMDEALRPNVGKRGKVFVHCMMGISRSSTVVAAYLMKTRSMNRPDAVRHLQKFRPQVHPNYGFVKQLDVFANCSYEPSHHHSLYRSWKRRHHQDATSYLNYIHDTSELVRDRVFLSTEFPTEATQAQSYLGDLNIACVLSISPSERIVSDVPGVHAHQVELLDDSADSMLRALPEIFDYITQAMEKKGLLLIHSTNEMRLCTVASAFLMALQRHTLNRALRVLENVVPLFVPSDKLRCDLEVIQTAGFALKPPTTNTSSWPISKTQRQQHDLQKVAAAILSETGIDMVAFGETLGKLQGKYSGGGMRVGVW